MMIRIAFHPDTLRFTDVPFDGAEWQQVEIQPNRFAKQKNTYYFYHLNGKIISPCFLTKTDSTFYKRQNNLAKNISFSVFSPMKEIERSSPSTSSQPTSSQSTLHKEETSDEEEDLCTVCLDECKSPLPCNHNIHLMCIAKSGKSECPLCKANVTLPQDLSTICEKTRQQFEMERKQQEERESADLARQLQRQEQARRTTTLSFPTHRMRITIDPEPDRWNEDDFTMEVARLMMNSHSAVTQMNSYQSVIDTFQLVYSLNRLSMNTGLSSEQLANILSLLTRQ